MTVKTIIENKDGDKLTITEHEKYIEIEHSTFYDGRVQDSKSILINKAYKRLISPFFEEATN